MNLLSEEKKNKAISLLDDFIKSGELIKQKDQFLKREEFQAIRKRVMAEIKSLIEMFLAGRIDLNNFKSKIDSINKKNGLWGFRGMKGQMFFNQLFKAVKDKSFLVKKLQNAISLPMSVEGAADKIDKFLNFVHESSTGISNPRLRPKEKSIPYFLSYFWQIQNPEKFPICYTSLERSFIELNFMPPDIENLSDQYKFFYNLNNELKEFFTKKTGRDFSYWDVEHVFWYYYVQKTPSAPKKEDVEIIEEDYIPPIVKEIPLLAWVNESVVKKYANRGQRVEDILEEKLYKLFLMLGYETDRLGRGKGRVPDGIARARQEGYGIIYDAKSRTDGRYSIKPDSRAIKEYIEEYSNVLHKEGLRKIYFVIISSDFQNGQEDEIKRIKMETGVQEILLLKADLSLFILELKLRDSGIDLGKYGLQQIFAYSGIISKEEIQEYLAGR